jgi:hypothetical protein
VLLVLLTLPLALELLLLTGAIVFKRRRPLPAAAPESFRLAVVIPAHNEETLLGACIASLRAQTTPGTSLYVIAHNCTDSTALLAAHAGAEVLLLNDDRGGKGLALDHGFRHALAQGAEAVLVIDADSTAGPGLLAAVAAAFAAGAHAVQARYEVQNASSTPRTRLAGLAFLGMNVLRPLGRQRLGLSCGIFGNGFALSAATLARVPYTPNSVVEDLEYHLHLVCAGIRVHFLNHAAVYGEMPTSGATASSQRARWEGGRILMRRTFAASLALAVARGQVRMLEPLLDLLARPLASQTLLLTLLCGVGELLRSPWLLAYDALAFIVIARYVVGSALLSPEPGATLRALLFAPAFLVWKILLIPATQLASRRDAAWVRTRRNAEAATANTQAKRLP